jgi:hypothetical protein
MFRFAVNNSVDENKEIALIVVKSELTKCKGHTFIHCNSYLFIILKIIAFLQGSKMRERKL